MDSRTEGEPVQCEELDLLAEYFALNLYLRADSNNPCGWAVWAEFPVDGSVQLVGLGDDVESAVDSARMTLQAWS